MQAQGYGEYPQNIPAYGHVHDPRQQKLLMDHRRGTGGGSPVSLQSPLYSSKQVYCVATPLVWSFPSAP